MYESTKVADAIKSRSKSIGIQLKDMLLELHLNKNTLSNMYNGSMLKGDSLARIADYLDCSVDYLLGRSEMLQLHQETFSQDEIELIHAYRCASQDDKIIVQAALRKYSQNEQEKTVSAG